MSRQLLQPQEIEQYLQGVEERAEHHANNVLGVIRTLAAAVFTKYPKDVIAFTRNGNLCNVVWIQGKETKQWYKFTYNHANESIDLMQGKNVIESFTNQTPFTSITQRIAMI
jgi:hypothetical protein